MARQHGGYMISLIAAVSEDLEIGLDGKIPWNIPEETASFKKLTFGHTVIMGRKTFEETGILEGRRNIVISKTLPKTDRIEVYGSLSAALDAAKTDKEIFIIGGASVFSQAIGTADRMYLSYIKGHYGGDAFFPKFNTAEWRSVKSEAHSKFTLVIYDRRRM